jgi:hypothetical protein
MITMTIRLPSKVYEDDDDCLHAAAAEAADDLGLESWQAEAKWEDGEDGGREHILVTLTSLLPHEARRAHRQGARVMITSHDADLLRSKIQRAYGDFVGWDWTYSAGCCGCATEEDIISEGAIFVTDWDAWEVDRKQELEADGHSERCAESVAGAERTYGEACQDRAEAAEEHAEVADRLILEGDLFGAIEELQCAASEERECGDSPTWGTVLKLAERVMEET